MRLLSFGSLQLARVQSALTRCAIHQTAVVGKKWSKPLPIRFATGSRDIVHDKINGSKGKPSDGLLYPGGAPLTDIVALDCEMVGVGPEGTRSALARVSIVNFVGDVIIDKLVKPTETIEDYRTKHTGLSEGSLQDAHPYETVKNEVHAILKGRIVVAHSAKHDFKVRQVLQLEHPPKLVQDTSRIKFASSRRRRSSLKKLCIEMLGLEVQNQDSHDSVEDARATLLLYRKFIWRFRKSS